VVAVWLGLQSSVPAAEFSFCPFPGLRIFAAVESLWEQRWKHVTRQSRDISCGSAALATILHYQFGDEVSEESLIRSILKYVEQKEVSRRGGFSLLDLKRVATDLGYQVSGYKLSLEQLVELGGPTLVPITLRGYKHFVVFRGMIGDRVVLADPSFGNLLVPDFLFQKVWQGVALAIERREKGLPIPASLAVTEGDFRMAETPDALRLLLQRGDFHNMGHPNEF